ncbi:MAG: ABC transporter permease [Bacteroidia bacterium]
MLRLLSIEFYKLRYTRYFWILAGLFLVFLLAVPIASKALLDYLSSIGETIFDNLNPADLPIFDFVDLWQNLTWIYSAFSIFLGFIIVISIGNEYSYGTIKQNIIDGMSRQEFLLSKLIFIAALSLIVSILAMIIGLIMGFLWSPVTDLAFILEHIEFIPAYFLHLFTFQVFCLVIGLLVKRSGITIAVLTFYVYVIEPIIASILEFKYEIVWLADLLPLSAIGNIIPLPFTKYAMLETQTSVGMDDLAILLGYAALWVFLAYRIITKRDLR